MMNWRKRVKKRSWPHPMSYPCIFAERLSEAVTSFRPADFMTENSTVDLPNTGHRGFPLGLEFRAKRILYLQFQHVLMATSDIDIMNCSV